MISGDKYVLATGDEGAHRLHIVNEVHGPDTERFICSAGIEPGMIVADIGCGTGVVSRWLGEQVSPGGEVFSIDVSPEQVERAKRETRDAGISNVHFSVASALRTGLPKDHFDLVFTRFMLMHLESPLEAIREMRSLVKPGGALACEDGDFTSPFCYPQSTAFNRLFELYRAIGAARGLDFTVGPKLYRMFLDAGFDCPEVSLVQPVFFRGEAKRLPEWTLTESAPALIEAGLATQEEIDSLTAELTDYAEDETALVAMAQMTQVWARK